MQPIDPPLAIYSSSERWAYVPIPKVACTSIQRALEYHFGLDPSPSVHGREWPEMCRVDALAGINGVLPFVFVRHPVRRLISVWAEKCESADKPGLSEFYASYAGQSFPVFVDAVAKTLASSDRVDKHICPQTAFMPLGVTCEVYIIEHAGFLGAQWRGLTQRYHFPQLKRYNASSIDRTKEAEALLTREVLSTIRAIYQSDCDRWFS